VTHHQVALWQRRCPLGSIRDPDKALAARVLPVVESQLTELSPKDVEVDVRLGPWRLSLRWDAAR
jgi:hypothetical protein